MKRTCVILMSVLFLLNAASSWASTEYMVKCTNGKCSFSSKYCIGPSNTSEFITGYCANCGKIVYLRYLRAGHIPVRGISDKPPKPAMTYWDPDLGKTVSLYSCPNCNKPFKPLDSEKDFKYCPKCGSETEIKETSKFVD